MWHFDWGVFFAVLTAGAIVRYFPGRYSDQWIAAVITKFLEKHDRMIELQEEQLNKQEEILDKFPL